MPRNPAWTVGLATWAAEHRLTVAAAVAGCAHGLRSLPRPVNSHHTDHHATLCPYALTSNGVVLGRGARRELLVGQVYAPGPGEPGAEVYAARVADYAERFRLAWWVGTTFDPLSFLEIGATVPVVYARGPATLARYVTPPVKEMSRHQRAVYQAREQAWRRLRARKVPR